MTMPDDDFTLDEDPPTRRTDRLQEGLDALEKDAKKVNIEPSPENVRRSLKRR